MLLHLHAEIPTPSERSPTISHTRQNKKNLPPSLLTSAQKRAIPINYALPTTYQTLPIRPIDLRNLLWSPPIPLPNSFSSPSPPLIPPLKPTQTASKTPEVVLPLILWHPSRQHTAHRNHTRSMRAHEQRSRSLGIGVEVCDHTRHGVGDAGVERGDGLAVYGGDEDGGVGGVELLREVRVQDRDGGGRGVVEAG